MDTKVTIGCLSIIESGDVEFAKNMLRRIAFIRSFEANAVELSKKTPPLVAGSVHLCAGQETIPLGALAALSETDKVLSTYRGHGWALAAGLDPIEVMAELCHRSGGINGGRAGSGMMMAPDRRFVGENSIIGAGVPIACGVAMAEVAVKSGNVVIVSIGDGAVNQGAVHEALNFATYKNLPLILVIENNDWAEYTRTDAITKVERLARRALTYGIEGLTIDGTDPMLVRNTVAAVAERVRSGNGPSIIECRVPRLWGHYNRDVEHYRSREDRAEAAKRDPLLVMGQRLIASNLMTQAEVDDVIAAEAENVKRVVETALASPKPLVATALDHVCAKPVKPESGNTSAATPPEEVSFINAVNAGMRDELASDPRTIVYGEDVGFAGGIFGGSKLLQKDFGVERVFDTPISETAILGAAVGAAMHGLKPIVEIMWADFMLVALDQLINQASNIRYITQGKSSAPMVVRTQQGVTPGSCAQHSQSLEALLAHIPGLKVCLSATPQDAYDLIREAAADPDPCIVIEARSLYPMKGMLERNRPVQTVGKARQHKSGCDAAIITWGTMLHPSLQAAEELSKQGIKVSVLDLRWLSPLDEESMIKVVKEADGKVLIIHEAVKTGGFGAEIAMRISELLEQSEMNLVIRRLATKDSRIPAAPNLQESLLPNSGSICQEIQRLVALKKTGSRLTTLTINQA